MDTALPLKVQIKWEHASGPLSPVDRLNTAFDTIAVSEFPLLALGNVIEVKSDVSLEEAVQVLRKHRIFSAPVLDVKADVDASWMEKYLGMIDFSGVVHWLLKQVNLLRVKAEYVDVDLFVKRKASEVCKVFKYRMKSVPVVESGKANIVNYITQGDVTHMLVQCSGLSWFDKLGQLSLRKLGLPRGCSEDLLYVDESAHIITAFELMSKHGVGGVPVLGNGSKKILGNISSSDVFFLLTAPEVFDHDSSPTVSNFLAGVRRHLNDKNEDSPQLRPVLTCRYSETLKTSIGKIDAAKVHRIYVVDDNEDLLGVVTLRDIIMTFAHEPVGYFGSFFDGVVPASPR